MPNTPPHLVAGGDIYAHRFVKMDATEENQGIQATANSDIIGITGDPTKHPPLDGYNLGTKAAEDGDSFLLKGDGEQCLIEVGAAVSAGSRLKSDANGKGVEIATTGTTLQRYGAIALQDGAADGELIMAQVQIGSERPAIA